MALQSFAATQSDVLREAILAATLASVQARDLYAEQTARAMSQALKAAQGDVSKAIVQYKGWKYLPTNKMAVVNGLGTLEKEIADILAVMKKEQTLRLKSAVTSSFQQGIYNSVQELAQAQLPFYRDLTPKGLDKLATNAFQIIDQDALDFSANYALQLAGDVNAETKGGISRVIRAAIATGKGPSDIVADLGDVIEDKDSFRYAGTKVFSKAQYRMELIARTEVIRAHNQGKKKFHEAVGITLLEWFTMEDERMCDQCAPLNGKTFSPQDMPNQPLHPQCLLPGTQVLAPNLLGGTIRGFDGVVVTLVTASGYRLSVTPNHPILTTHGWVAAGLLNEGDEVIESADSHLVALTVEANNEDVPTDVEEITRLLLEDSHVLWGCMPIAAEDFHGDGIDGQVNVVWTYGSLPSGYVAVDRQHVREVLFGNRDGVGERSQLFDPCLLDAGFDGGVGSTDRVMGGIGQGETLLCRHALHTQHVCFAGRSLLDAISHEDAMDRRTPDGESGRERQGGFTTVVAGDDLRSQHVENRLLHGTFRDAEVIRHLIDSHSPLVRISKILAVEKKRTATHVYNLSTMQGWYVADGIITHNCRCTHVPAWPLVVCGAGLLGQELPAADTGVVAAQASRDATLINAVAALHAFAAVTGATDGAACILPPAAIDEKVKMTKADAKAIKDAYESSNPDALSMLTIQQLRLLSKSKGIAVARTKADFLSLLDVAEPGVDHTGLAGASLSAKLKQFGIPNLRSKDELIALLKVQQAQEAAALAVKVAVQSLPPGASLESMSLADLKDLAVQKGVSLNMNKDDVIALLDTLEPGVDHSLLTGQALKDAKGKWHIGPLKNKSQLVAALQKVAGQELAGQVVQETATVALTAAQAALEAAMASGALIPPTPYDWQAFLAALKNAEAALAAGEGLPAEMLQKAAAELAAKKLAFQAQLGSLTSTDLKAMAKATAFPKYQFANKAECLALMSETDATLVAEAQASLDAKWLKWDAKHGTGKGKSVADALAQSSVSEAAQAAAEAALKAEAAEAAAQAAEAAAKAELQVQMAKSMLVDSSLKVAQITEPEDFMVFLAKVKEYNIAMATHGGVISPEDVASYGDVVQQATNSLVAKLQAMKSTDLKKLAQAKKLDPNWPYFSKDQLIEMMTSGDTAKKDEISAIVAAKVKGYAGKGGKKAVAASADEVASIVVPPVPSAPATSAAAHALESAEFPPLNTTLPGSHYADLDERWERITESGDAGDHFTFVRNASDLGGVHPKSIYRDVDGNDWLFKPTDEMFIADADEMVYRVSRLVDPHAIEVRRVRVNGELGTIQRMKKGLKSPADYDRIAVTDIADSEVAQLLQHHVMDWLISNHDAHTANFLRLDDGTVVAIDRAQAFKFFGRDKLAIDYNPTAMGEHTSTMYNLLFRAAKNKQITIDPRHTLAAIERIEAIDDQVYLSLLQPYALGRPGDATQFLQDALARKKNLRKDFEQLYRDTLGDQRFSFATLKKKTATALDAVEVVDEVPEVLPKALLKDVLSATDRETYQGVHIPFDTDMVEDTNLHVFTERVPKRSGSGYDVRTVYKMKLRPSSQSRFLDALGDETGATPSFPKVGELLNEDAYFDRVTQGLRTINHHLSKGDRGFNTSRINTALSCKPELEALLRHERIEIRDMAEHYLASLKEIERVMDGDNTPIPILRQFRVRAGRVTPPPVVESPVFTVTKGKSLTDRRKTIDGVVHVEEEGVEFRQLFPHSYRLGEGQQITVKFPDGTVIRYRPFTQESGGPGNPFAHSGDFEMLVPGKATSTQIESVFARMEQLNIPAQVAPDDYQEYLYLHKVAYINNLHLEHGYKSFMQSLDARGLTVTERVDEMAKFWSNRLGVEDVRRLPKYNPFGSYDYDARARKSGGAIGLRVTHRFDIDIEEQMKDHSLLTQLVDHPASDYVDLVDVMLANNGSMVSTTEKARIGVPITGMSPEADMDSGGASFVFTRWRKDPRTVDTAGNQGFFFHRRLAGRTDAVSFPHDEYGRCTGDNVQVKRITTVQQWKKAAVSQSDNETVIKQGFSFLDNLDVIVLNDRAQVARMIEVFRKHGVTKLPDGRDIKNVVIYRARAKVDY